MKLSERTVKRLGEIITGDKGFSPTGEGQATMCQSAETSANH